MDLNEVTERATDGGNPSDTWAAYGLDGETLHKWALCWARNVHESCAGAVQEVIEEMHLEDNVDLAYQLHVLGQLGTALTIGLATGIQLERERSRQP